MPDRRTSPRSWEAAWQQDFERFYGSEGPPQLSDMVPLAVANVLDTSVDSPMIYEQNRRALCRNQEGAVYNIAGAFAELDFEQKWKASTQEEREKAILEGIVHSFDDVFDMDMKRIWCPDSSLKHLAAQDGNVYIQALKALLPSDVGATIQEPLSVPCQAVDDILTLTEEEQAHAGYRVLAFQMALCRNDCMTAILTNILLTFVCLLFCVYAPNPRANLSSMTSVVARSRTDAFCPRDPNPRRLDRWLHLRPCT